MPSFLGYIDKHHALPKCITTSFAFYIQFYRGYELTDAGLVAKRPAADGLHRHTSLQRNEAGERVSSRMVGIGLARFRQLADGDEIDTNTIRAQQWEKGISCPVLVSRHQLQRLGQEFHPGKCSGLLAVIDEPFVAILHHLDIGFRNGNGVYEGCSCIAGEKKQVTANG